MIFDALIGKPLEEIGDCENEVFVKAGGTWYKFGGFWHGRADLDDPPRLHETTRGATILHAEEHEVAAKYVSEWSYEINTTMENMTLRWWESVNSVYDGDSMPVDFEESDPPPGQGFVSWFGGAA